jgi:hypothetical protein
MIFDFGVTSIFMDDFAVQERGEFIMSQCNPPEKIGGKKSERSECL